MPHNSWDFGEIYGSPLLVALNTIHSWRSWKQLCLHSGRATWWWRPQRRQWRQQQRWWWLTVYTLPATESHTAQLISLSICMSMKPLNCCCRCSLNYSSAVCVLVNILFSCCYWCNSSDRWYCSIIFHQQIHWTLCSLLSAMVMPLSWSVLFIWQLAGQLWKIVIHGISILWLNLHNNEVHNNKVAMYLKNGDIDWPSASFTYLRPLEMQF